MFNAVALHSDHLELREQFGKDSGYEKSVRDLTPRSAQPARQGPVT
jgi:hypothetical protein